MKNKTLIAIIIILATMLLLAIGGLAGVLIFSFVEKNPTTTESETVTEQIISETESDTADIVTEAPTEENLHEVTPESFVGDWHEYGKSAEEPGGFHTEIGIVGDSLSVRTTSVNSSGSRVAGNDSPIYVSISDISESTFYTYISEDGHGNSANIKVRCFYKESINDYTLEVTVYNVVDHDLSYIANWGLTEGVYLLYK